MNKNNPAPSGLHAEVHALLAAHQGDGPDERISLVKILEAAKAAEAVGTTTSGLTSWLEVRISYLHDEVEALTQAYQWATLFANRVERRRLLGSTVMLRSVAANINIILCLIGTPSKPSAFDASDEDTDSIYLHALKAWAMAKQAIGRPNNTSLAEQHAQAMLGSPSRPSCGSDSWRTSTAAASTTTRSWRANSSASSLVRVTASRLPPIRRCTRS
ncbi:hypothetical protein [Teichococcus oryzae]|uniref:Uncharacterized protein n=1 Tax=Teichococcus oryzae TaxID=1608942 RepID=A0A5B2TBK5_9PROT|nr:hypothetical protein [Pseudoroseomonas oryzae]KAA2211445.1 hypothetical protein F0Q34_19945 [Pseudoroseomonas oryzae]